MKKKLVAGTKFAGGARIRAYYVPRPPEMAAIECDYLLIEMRPEKGRGKTSSWFVNEHDATELIRVVASGISALQQRRYLVAVGAASCPVCEGEDITVEEGVYRPRFTCAKCGNEWRPSLTAKGK
jgi:hypothetical protein